MREAAFSRSLSACLLSRSALASKTVFLVVEAVDGDHDVLAKGFPTLPLRLTLRGRLELPVKVGNMANRRGGGVTRDGRKACGSALKA